MVGPEVPGAGESSDSAIRPRVLLAGDFDGSLYSEEMVSRLTGRGDISVVVEPWLSRVHLGEFDCVVTAEPLVTLDQQAGADVWAQRFPESLCVIHLLKFPERRLSWVLDAWPEVQNPPVTVEVHRRPRGQVRSVPVPEALAELVRTSLKPALRRSEWRQEVVLVHSGDLLESGGLVLPVQPFLESSEGAALAGRYERNERASVWFLPDDLPRLDEWILAALDEWHAKYPDRFPEIATWVHDAEYMTPPEREIAQSMRTRRDAFEAARVSYERAQEEDAQALAVLRHEADRYPRALLSRQGRELEVAVGQFLEDCQFGVRDMNDEYPEDARREDFRISVEGGEWEALVEVKGFTKGVNQAALDQLHQHAEHYETETGREPDAVWLIANTFLRKEPEGRQRQGLRSDVLGTFSRKNGLLLDTRVAFKIAVALQQGTVQAADVREFLRTAKGEPSLDGLIPVRESDG